MVFAAISPASAESVREARGRLAASIVKKDFPGATAAVDALMEIGTPKAMEALISVGMKGDYYGLEQYIGGRILGLPKGEAFERVCELASAEPNPRARVLLTLALGMRPEGSAFTALLQNLFDKDDGVVLAAIEKVQEKDSTASIGPLIDGLAYQEKRGRADGLLAFEIRKTLLQLTREDIVRSEDWRNWWDPRKENFERPPEGAAEGVVTSVYKDPSRFFGIEVPSEKVVFLLDVSGSMSEVDPAPEESGDDAGGRGPIPESRQRLRRIQRELIRTIEMLPEKTQFNIITFCHEILPLEEHLLPANSRNKSKAISFIRDFEANGETWTDHALLRAFEVEGLRAIFLLSDGAPRRGDTPLDTEPILEWLREANRFSRVRIHTIGFEQAGKSMRAFLKRIAVLNHGEYRELR